LEPQVADWEFFCPPPKGESWGSAPKKIFDFPQRAPPKKAREGKNFENGKILGKFSNMTLMETSRRIREGMRAPPTQGEPGQ